MVSISSCDFDGMSSNLISYLNNIVQKKNYNAY